MENNALFNLTNQLTQEMKSLWRIDRNYINDALTEEERVFWRNLKSDKENHVKEIRNLIKALLG